jgi:hypothetical protein
VFSKKSVWNFAMSRIVIWKFHHSSFKTFLSMHLYWRWGWDKWMFSLSIFVNDFRQLCDWLLCVTWLWVWLYCAGGMQRNDFYCFARCTEQNISLKVWLSASVLKVTYFNNFLCRRTKTGGPAVISDTVAGSYFCKIIVPAGDTVGISHGPFGNWVHLKIIVKKTHFNKLFVHFIFNSFAMERG